MEQVFSDAAYRLSGQPMFQILTRIKEMERQGKHIVHFEIGDPDFDTPYVVREAAKEALDNGYTHYSSAIGDYELRSAIVDTGFFTPSFTPDIDQILVSPSANILIYYAVRCLVNEGEEVIIPDPSFSSYQSVLNFCNVKAVRLPLKYENEFKTKAEDVEQLITDKTRLIIINSPNNPTGAVSERIELEKIGKMCLERGIYLYCDEIYQYLNYTGDTLYSPAILDKCKERMIIATGFSKALAMTGWRLGVAIAPRELVEKMALMVETTSSCTPTFVQKAAIKAVYDGKADVERMVGIYKDRRDFLVQRLNKIKGISCPVPEGAFYVFPSIREVNINSKIFSEKLLEEAGVGVCPGIDFGKYGEGCIRLCYATSLSEIEEGMNRLEKFMNEEKYLQ